MPAILAIPFFAVLPGNVYPETIPTGSEIDGELAKIAGDLGLLVGPVEKTEFGLSVPIVVQLNEEISATVQEVAKRSRKAAARAPEVKA